jgi:hypothetical protein
MLVSAFGTLAERIAPHSWAQPIFGTLFAIFAGIAPPLASVGLYAVIAHSVRRRTQEIGVPMASDASEHPPAQLHAGHQATCDRPRDRLCGLVWSDAGFELPAGAGSSGFAD